MRLEYCPKSFALAICIAGFFSVGSFAYPENPLPYSIDNGGDSLTVRKGGDEHFRFTQTEDGILVVAGEDGLYYYADENGAASKFKAKNADRRSASEKAFLKKIDRNKAFNGHRSRHGYNHRRPDGENRKRAAWVPTAPAEPAPEDAPPVLRLPDPKAHANGTNRIPVILVENNYEKNLDSAMVDSILNRENYTAKSYRGSVRDYFVDQSHGLFVPTFDLYFVKVENPFVDYVDKDYVLIQEAIEALKSKYARSEERRVGKECRSRWSPYH